MIDIDEGANEKISARVRLADISRAAKQDHIASARRLISRFTDWTEEIGGLGRALYAKYREINEQHRTEPRPPCFDIDYSLPETLAAAPTHKEPASGGQVAKSNELVKRCSKKIGFALNKYLGVYKTIGELAPEDLTGDRASSFDVAVEEIYQEIGKGLDNA